MIRRYWLENIAKESHMFARRKRNNIWWKEGVPTNHLQTQTTVARSMIKKFNKFHKNFNKLVKILQKSHLISKKHLKYQRLMKNESWNETWTNSKEFEVSDQKVVTREHHKRISYVRQDIIKEQHMMERRSPNESFTNTNDHCKIDDQKVE